MGCREMNFDLVEAALGSVRPQLALHLQSCTACVQSLTEMRQLMALLDEWRVKAHLARVLASPPRSRHKRMHGMAMQHGRTRAL